MPFPMPESYRAYCTDPAVRTAVDHILLATGRKGALSLPPDIDWKDLPAFHRAVLSAHQVRCEFAILAIDLWNAVWQPALAECGFDSSRDACTVSRTEELIDLKLDTHSVWELKWFSRCFEIRGGGDLQLYLAVIHELPEALQLGFCLWGADGTDHTTGCDFGDEWPKEPGEEGWIYTGKDLAPIQDGTIDLGSLHTAAADALTTARRHIRG